MSLLALIVSCKEPTQITLEVTTDGRCPGEEGTVALFRTLGIAAGQQISNTAPETFTATTSECVSAPMIGTLVLVPAGEREGDLVDVLVVASMERGELATPLDECEIARTKGDISGTSCVVARRRLGFVDGIPLTLPIELEAACIGVTCDEDATCFGGVCVDSSVACDANGCSRPGEMPGSGSNGSGANGSGANGSGANGSGANGSGANGSGGAGPGPGGSGGAISVGGSGGTVSVGGSGGVASVGGNGGAPTVGGSGGSAGPAGGSTGSIVSCPPLSVPVPDCGTQACVDACMPCEPLCTLGSPCICGGGVDSM